jgi:lysozyme
VSRFGADTLARALAAVRGAPAAVQSLPAAPSLPVADDALALAAALCRRFEGLRLRPYLCPAGVPTIGYGSTQYADGRPVQLDDAPITAERAEAMLQRDLRVFRFPAVRKLCPGAVTAGQQAALADFAFNLGTGALAASTLRKRVNAGQWEQVPDELRRWVRAGGTVLRGLVARREAEAALIGR